MSDIRAQAVIVVDVQADFTQYRNGALAVPGPARITWNRW